MNAISHRFALGLALAAALAPAARAQTGPAAYLERSQVVPTGKTIHAYRVPTTDLSGKRQYFDLAIDLAIDDKGKVAGTATVLAVKSPPVQGTQFVNGTYKTIDGSVECTLGVSMMLQGRQQASLMCLESPHGYNLSASWATGEITGHPFELDLRAAGIDQIDGYLNYGWGKLGIASGGFSWWGCMNTGEVISAVQAGSQLTINGYDLGNVQKCGVTFTLQQ